MHLDALPRLGWIQAPSPITPLPELAESLGLEWLGLKRDDQIEALHGGTKTRKLDLLLATPRLAEAPAWASVGAIGSGHLVALRAAAERLDRGLRAHVFWQPPLPSLRENLAYLASGPTELRYSASRLSLGLRHPRVLLARRVGELAVIAPGASTPPGVAGMARVGAELRAQIEAGALPVPDEIVVALGSGGTAVGLALGVALAGLPTKVRAVAVTERIFTSRRRLRGLMRDTLKWLRQQGIEDLPTAPRLPEVVHGYLGRAYGIATPASLRACEQLPMLDPIYSGKAMAALMATAGSGKVLFWVTPRRAGPLPAVDDWEDRLPAPLRRRLAGRGPGRRYVLLGGAAGLLALRLCGYPEGGGQRLMAWEAAVILAASRALFGALPEAAHAQTPARAEGVVEALPPKLRRLLRAALAALEQASPLGGSMRRFTRLGPEDRLAHLESLAARPLLSDLYRAVRDLCAFCLYQQPATWPAIAYPGPMLPDAPRPDRYAALMAAPGSEPEGWSA